LTTGKDRLAVRSKLNMRIRDGAHGKLCLSSAWLSKSSLIPCIP
jgi:hypothetical protein